MGESNDFQNLNDEQDLQGGSSFDHPIKFAAATTNSFIADSLGGLYQESNPEYHPSTPMMVDDFPNLKDLSINEQYPQGRHSRQPISFPPAAATDSFISGSSSGLYQEESNLGLSNLLMFDDFSNLKDLSINEQYPQASHSRQPISFAPAAATDSFIAGSSSGLHQEESNLGLSYQYHPPALLMVGDFPNLNDLSIDEQYPQGSHSEQPISFAPATDCFISGSSSRLYQEESNLGPSNQNYLSVPLASDSFQNMNNLSSHEPMDFAVATNKFMGSSSRQYQESLPSTQCDPGPSSQNYGLAPFVSDDLQNQNNLISEEEQYLASIPIGYRFQPTDLELVGYYLPKKVMEQPLRQNRIWNINVYQHDPDVLTGFFPLLRESEWYFFSSRKRKYPKGNRPDRATPGGFWKPNTSVVDICDRRGNVVGKKTVLDFYKGKPKGGERNERTTWKMYEYVLPKDDAPAPRNNGNDMLLDKVVLCKIYPLNAPKDGSDPQPSGQPDLQNAYIRSSHFGQPTTFSPETKNITGSSGALHQESFPSTQYNPGPDQGDTDLAATMNNMLESLDNRSTSHNTYTGSVYTQDGHFGQPISCAPATDNMTGFTSWQWQEYLPSTQYNLRASNQTHQSTSFVSRLEQSTLAGTTNNAGGSPSVLHQESLPSEQYNVEPLNPYLLELAPGVSGLGTAEKLCNDQSLPATQHYESYHNNVNQLPSDLGSHSTPLVPTIPPTVQQLNDFFNELSEALQDPSLRCRFGSSIDPNYFSIDKNNTHGKK